MRNLHKNIHVGLGRLLKEAEAILCRGRYAN